MKTMKVAKLAKKTKVNIFLYVVKKVSAASSEMPHEDKRRRDVHKRYLESLFPCFGGRSG